MLSPDGSWVLFVDDATGSLLRAPFEGGAVETLYRDPEGDNIRPLWVGAEEILVSMTTRVIRLGQQSPEELYRCPEAQGRCLSLSVVPLTDGSILACIGLFSSRDQLVRLQAGLEPELLLDNACHPHQVGDRLIFKRGEELWAARFDATSGRIGAPISTGVQPHRYIPGEVPHAAVADEGTLVYLDAAGRVDLWRVDGSGRARERLVHGEGAFIWYSVSPDERQAVIKNETSWRLADLEEGSATRAVQTGDAYVTLGWVDVDRVLALELGSAALQEYDLQARRLRTIELPDSDVRPDLLRAIDLKRGELLFDVYRDAEKSGIVRAPIDLSNLEIWLDTDAIDRSAAVSPDGRWIAWETNVDGQFEVNVSPWPGAPRPFPVSIEGGEEPRWSPDSRTLYFIDLEHTSLMAADLRPGGTPPFTKPRVVFPLPDRAVNAGGDLYYPLSDGTFVFAIAEREQRVRLVFNWLDEVDARLDAAESGTAATEPSP